MGEQLRDIQQLASALCLSHGELLKLARISEQDARLVSIEHLTIQGTQALIATLENIYIESAVWRELEAVSV